jgi:hypothetical protein
VRATAIALVTVAIAGTACSSGGSGQPKPVVHVLPQILEQTLRSAPKVVSFSWVANTAVSGKPQPGLMPSGRHLTTFDLHDGSESETISRTNPTRSFHNVVIHNAQYFGQAHGQWIELDQPRRFWGTLGPQQPGDELVPYVAKASVTSLGAMTINGSVTTHYRAVETLRAYLLLSDACAPSPPKEKRVRFNTVPAGVNGSVMTDLYLSSRGLPARVVLTIRASFAGGTTSTSVTTRTYSDYNSAPAVHRPARSTVKRVIVAKNVTQEDKALTRLG